MLLWLRWSRGGDSLQRGGREGGRVLIWLMEAGWGVREGGGGEAGGSLFLGS